MTESRADFICICGGTYAIIPGIIVDGMRAFRCDSCGREGPLECPLCHCPRTIWKKYGEECLFCAKGYGVFTMIFRHIINSEMSEKN